MDQCQKTFKESVFEAFAAYSAATASKQPGGVQPSSVPILPPVSDDVSFQPMLRYSPDTFFLKQPMGLTEHTCAPSVPSDNDVLLQTLSLYTRRLNPTFTSENQRLLLEEVLKARHENILAVLPTGAGKSIAIFGPLLVQSTGLSVVITPYTALRYQLTEQAKAFDIKHLVWSQRNTSGSPYPLSVRLVIMIADDLFTEEAKT